LVQRLEVLAKIVCQKRTADAFARLVNLQARLPNVPPAFVDLITLALQKLTVQGPDMKRPHDDLKAGTRPELAFAFRELRLTDPETARAARRVWRSVGVDAAKRLLDQCGASYSPLPKEMACLP
jgi:hypothetical protein